VLQKINIIRDFLEDIEEEPAPRYHPSPLFKYLFGFYFCCLGLLLPNFAFDSSLRECVAPSRNACSSSPLEIAGSSAHHSNWCTGKLSFVGLIGFPVYESSVCCHTGTQTCCSMLDPKITAVDDERSKASDCLHSIALAACGSRHVSACGLHGLLVQDVLAKGDLGAVWRSPGRLQGAQQCKPSCAVSQSHGHRRPQV